MREEYFLNAVRMLQSQLKEEEEHYEKALKEEREFFELKQIRQRIRSLKQSLFAMEAVQLKSLKQKVENFA